MTVDRDKFPSGGGEGGGTRYSGTSAERGGAMSELAADRKGLFRVCSACIIIFITRSGRRGVKKLGMDLARQTKPVRARRDASRISRWNQI